MAVFFVKPTGSRPDFRLVIAFLWGDSCNCDTDGNSVPVTSREWTELYCQNRDNYAEVFDVSPSSERPLVLEISSPHEWLAARVAYFLAIGTKGGVSDWPEGPFVLTKALESRIGDFDLVAALNRVRQSRFFVTDFEENQGGDQRPPER